MLGSSLYENSQNIQGQIICGVWCERVRYPGAETPITPDGPDNSTVVMLWKGLGLMAGDGFIECVGLEGGLCPWWYVDLLPKMVNKINAIEYSGGTGFISIFTALLLRMNHRAMLQ
jgi:hypothetical protein